MIYHTALQAHTGEKLYKSAEMVESFQDSDLSCLQQLTSKRQHIDIMCVDPRSIGRRIDAHDVNMMLFCP